MASIPVSGPKCGESLSSAAFGRCESSVSVAVQEDSVSDRLRVAGWVRSPTWVDPACCGEAKQRLDQLVRGGARVVRNPHLEDGWFCENLICGPAEAVLGPILGGDLAIENVFAVAKMSDQRFEVPWHQDGINPDLELDPSRSIAVWIAITHATVSNGCLEVASGSHRRGYRPPVVSDEVQAGAGRPTMATVDQIEGATKVELSPGDALLMDTRLLHCSGSNRTDFVRYGVNVRFVAPGGIGRITDPTREIFSLRSRALIEAGDYVRGVNHQEALEP